MKQSRKKRPAARSRKPPKPAARITTATLEPCPAPASKVTKKDAVLALIRRAEGASLAELIAATGWQAHSVRGFLSGSVHKKLGITITRTKREDGLPAYKTAEEQQ